MTKEPGCTCSFDISGEPLYGGYVGCRIHDPNMRDSENELSEQISAARKTNLAPSREEGLKGAGKFLFDLLAEHGGTIESTGSLSVYDINQARANGRMYVDENSLGFVWMPKIDKFPTTKKEVEFLEKWFPLPVELPEHLKSLDFLHKKKEPTPGNSERMEKEAVGFAEWANTNYHHVFENLWDGDNDETFKTDELYAEYLKSKPFMDKEGEK